MTVRGDGQPDALAVLRRRHRRRADRAGAQRLRGPVNIGNPDELTVLRIARVDPRTGRAATRRSSSCRAADRRPAAPLPGHHAGARASSAGSRREATSTAWPRTDRDGSAGPVPSRPESVPHRPEGSTDAYSRNQRGLPRSGGRTHRRRQDRGRRRGGTVHAAASTASGGAVLAWELPERPRPSGAWPRPGSNPRTSTRSATPTTRR